MDSEALSVVKQMFDTIDDAVPRNQKTQTQRARELFELLEHDGGQVEAIGEPEYNRTRIAELGTWSNDPWEGATYGVDASTTRPLEYNNGLVINTGYAKTAVVGEDADREIEREGHISTVVYYDDDDSTLHPDSFDSEFIEGELIPFPASAEETRNVQKSVSTVAQRDSESQQALKSLDEIDGALLLDGSVLPLGVIYWLLLDYAGERSPAGSWDRPAEIVANYIQIIDRQYERSQPFVGVVKTSSMSQVLAALEKKIKKHDVRDENGRLRDVPWTRDNLFMAEVLRQHDLEYLTYTSWLTHKQQKVGSRHYELLEPVADRLQNGTPEDYRRAFFYLRLPKTGDVFRIETPKLFIEDEGMREQVRLKALKEIAQRQNEPRAIARADKLVRITRENREKIRGMVESETAYDHNWDGRWNMLEDDNPEEN